MIQIVFDDALELHGAANFRWQGLRRGERGTIAIERTRRIHLISQGSPFSAKSSESLGAPSRWKDQAAGPPVCGQLSLKCCLRSGSIGQASISRLAKDIAQPSPDACQIDECQLPCGRPPKVKREDNGVDGHPLVYAGGDVATRDRDHPETVIGTCRRISPLTFRGSSRGPE